MKIEGLFFRAIEGMLSEEEKAQARSFIEDVIALRQEIQSLEPEEACIFDYEQSLIKIGELVINDIV